MNSSVAVGSGVASSTGGVVVVYSCPQAERNMAKARKRKDGVREKCLGMDKVV